MAVGESCTGLYPVGMHRKRFRTANAEALTKGSASPRAVVCVVVALVLAVGANAWAVGYVSAERYIYSWDWATYWLMFEHLGGLLRSDTVAALTEVRTTIAGSDYNFLPILPLMPFELAFGPGRLSYILAITNAALLPSAALMALVVERVMTGRSWGRVLLCTAGVLGLHVLWAPALRGLPDVIGVAVACAILLVYFSDLPQRHRPIKLAGIGLLLCLLILTRRYYLFWVVGFFPAAMLGYFLGTPRADLDRKVFFAVARNLAIAAASCGAFLLILAAPLLRRIATTDYSAEYGAYRSELVGAGAAGQVIDHFGVALLVVCAAGLGWLATRRDARSLSVLLIAQALFAFGLFTRVQTLLGVQHYYLLVPAAGIGIAASLAALWNSKLRAGWRATGVAAVMAVVLLSSVAVFSPSHPALGPLMPRVRYAPLVRPDLAELQRLLAALAALKPDHVYVAASSQMFNWSILDMGCRDTQPDLCPHIAVTEDIDMRDGFPRAVLDADYVVLATPTQYHVRPEDQRVVGLVARDIREGRGIGVSFERLPSRFELAQGIKVAIYRRFAPLRSDAVKALGEELRRSHPQTRTLFEPPASSPLREGR